MKKSIVTLLLALLVRSAWGINAYPYPITVSQPDGTELTIISHGDEHYNYVTTADGALLVQKGRHYFIAQTDSEGRLSSTGLLAHNPALRTAQEKAAIAAQNQSLHASLAAARIRAARPAAARAASVPDLPHTGTLRVLVVLAQFSDVKYTVNEPLKAFDELLNWKPTDAATSMTDYGNHNTSNQGSVVQYFESMSGDQFHPVFDVAGIVTLDHDIAYYGEDERTDLLIPDVCKKAKDVLGTDFTQYDADGDGFVDLVYVCCAGYSQAWGNDTKYVWPKSGWRTFSETFDGKQIKRYGLSTELCGVEGQQTGYIDGIGVFCHEFSHCLGLPDFYSTSSDTECKTADNQAMQEWSILDAGAYVGNGYRPTAYTAWERAELGWFELTDLTESQTSLTLSTIDAGGKAYRIKNPANAQEYFVLQNIQKTGWNRSQRGHGLLVYHVDYNADIFNVMQNTVNATLGHPRMTVVPADGLLMNNNNSKYQDLENLAQTYRAQEAGDVFPGTESVSAWTAESGLPNSSWFTGESAIGFSLTNITEDTEQQTVSFSYTAPTSDGIDGIEADTDREADIHTLSGVHVGTDPSALPKGIYIVGKKKVVVR